MSDSTGSRKFLTELAAVSANGLAAFAGISIVVSVRNSSVGWLVVAFMAFVATVLCVIARVVTADP